MKEQSNTDFVLVTLIALMLFVVPISFIVVAVYKVAGYLGIVL